MCGERCHCGHGGDCGCGEERRERFVRRYQTRAEEIADLEGYLADLKAEVQAVEEHLADLRRQG